MGRRAPMEIGGLEDWMIVFRKFQAREIWAQHGAWVEQLRPGFGPEVAARFEWARTVSVQPLSPEVARRRPSPDFWPGSSATPGSCCCPARRTSPRWRGLEGVNAQSFRDRTLSLTCIARLARLPQVNLPAETRVNGCPVGLSLIGPRGSDRALLALVSAITT